MVYVAIAQNMVILLLVWALVKRERENAQDKLDLIASNETERAQLLERIQRPEIPPHLRVQRAAASGDRDEIIEAAKQAQAAYGRVGTVQPIREATEG